MLIPEIRQASHAIDTLSQMHEGEQLSQAVPNPLYPPTLQTPAINILANTSIISQEEETNRKTT